MLTIVRVGSWLYDGSVEKPVDIISLDYDWWYSLAEADGQLEQDEVPKLMGPDGCLYYVRFRCALDPSEPTWPDSGGFSTIEEATACAESKVASGIRWQTAT